MDGQSIKENGLENPLANFVTLGHGLDLLTGDVPIQSQPATFETSTVNDTPSLTASPSWDLLFSDSSDPLHTFEDPLRKIDDMSTSRDSVTATNDYLDSVKALCGSNLAKRLEYLEAVELEIIRFGLGMSAADRDHMLLSIGKDPVSVDPNRLLPSSYSAQVSQTAAQLAAINQVAHEDEILSRIGLEDLDLESFSEGKDDSYGCEVHGKRRGDRLRTHTWATGLVPCRFCHRKACATCRVCEEEIALAGSFTGLAGTTAPAFQTLNWENCLCKKCCPQIILDALRLDYLKALGSERRKNRIKSAAARAIKEIHGDNLHSFWDNNNPDFDKEMRQLETFLMGEKSIAEYPHASLLASVPAAETSESCLSLLASPFLGSRDSYYKAPSGVTSVMLTIVLSTPSAVSGLLLLVSPCGYSVNDIPSLEVWSGNWITETGRSFIGSWDLKTEVAAAPHLYGEQISGESGSRPLRALSLKFKKYEHCRILWLKLTLQNPSRASLDSKFELMSFGTSSIKQKSHGGAVEPPCIHARRIIVVGKHLQEPSDSEGPAPTSTKQAWRTMLEQPVPSGRFKIQPDAEAYKESDRVVEQVFPATAPSIAGFRLDSLYTFKNTLKFIPGRFSTSASDSILDPLEGLLINPGSLFIQVSAVQEDRLRAHVGYFFLPITQAATPLYFDFRTPLQARELTFKLVGDVTAYSDERNEPQNDALIRDPPMASGLSLANKIKVYRYALVSEMGKWGLLSAV